MLRQYALVIFNNKDEIIDRINIDIATNSSGNGFELELATISSDLEDIITSVKQKKLQVIFTISQVNNSYVKADVLAQWIQKYSRPEYTMALEWRYGNNVRYCVGKVTKLTKGDRLYIEVLQQQFVFTQTTPWFMHRENVIIYEESSIGKNYPYKYPYSYGSQIVKNNIIENNYITEIPLMITIDGAINNPIISLSSFEYINGEKVNIETYNYIKFEDLILKNTQQIIIDSGKRKITLLSYSDLSKKQLIGQEDITHKVSDDSDTFLRLQAGFSEINYNRETVDENFKITGTWRQYLL